MKELSIKHLDVIAQIDNDLVKIVDDFSFSFTSSTCIIGESGSGKSMIAQSLVNILPQNCSINGEIIYDSSNISNDLSSLRGKLITYVPQGGLDHLNPCLKIKKIIEQEFNRLNKKYDLNEVIELLNKFNLDKSVLEKYPFELSGGMAQRIILLSSLLTDSDIYIFDEPTNGLDNSNKEDFMKLFNKFFKSKITIFITHDLTLLDYFKKIIVLKNGKIVEVSSSKDEFKDEYSKCLLEASLTYSLPKDYKYA